jgi:DNA-binding NarL/FixJ family response regulator
MRTKATALEARRLGNGELIVRPEKRHVRRTPGEVLGLTVRQSQVLELVHAGLKDSAIGAELKMSTRTVNAHLAMVFARLRVNSRGLAMLAWERATVELPRWDSQGYKPRKKSRLSP